MIDPSIVFSCVDKAADPDDLKKRLAERGIEVEFIQTPGAAEPTGWSLRPAGLVGSWIKGSDVSRELSIKKVLDRIERRRRVRQVAANREALGDLLDAIDESFRARLVREEEVAGLEEECRIAMKERQKGLATLLLQLPIHAVRVAIGGLINGLAFLIERLFGMPHESLGRFTVPQFESKDVVPVGVMPPAAPRPAADADELKRRAAAQKVMLEVLDQVCTAIEQGKPEHLPGLAVKDVEVQAARAGVFKAIEEARLDSDDEGQDDAPRYERERPR